MGLLRIESAPSCQDAFRAVWRQSRDDRRLPVWLLRGLQVGSVVVIGGELVVGVYGLMVNHEQSIVAVASSVADVPDPRIGAEPAPSLASAAAARPLFSATPPAAGSAPAQAAPALSEQAQVWAARLTMLGAMTGKIAQAVIEDTQTHKTYLVTVGQRVLEGLVVEEIRENQVVLSWQGEHVELSL